MSSNRGSVSLHSEPLVGPSRKRRRVGMACISCRSRKSRCSGQRPRCSTCVDLDLKCEYISTGTQHGQLAEAGKEYLQNLEARLRTLEQVVGDHFNKQTNSSRQSLGDTDSCRSITGQGQPLNSDPKVIGDDDNDVESRQSDDPTDGMGHYVFANEEDRAFFGPSSSIAFTSEVSVVLARLCLGLLEQDPATGHGSSQHPPDRPTHPGYRIARVPRPHSMDMSDKVSIQQTNPKTNDNRPVVSSSSIFYLPPEEETSSLIDRYFNNTGLLFPYLDEKTFRNSYAQLRRGNFASLGRTWLGLLNMVLAMATYTSIAPGEDAINRHTKSERFYRRANSLCEGQIMTTASLEIVQYLLLASQYMQGSKSSIQTSATHGLAVKIAMQLGLHSTEASKKFPPLEREIRKRVWFGCVILDRSLSMSFGRPASIPEAYCRLDLPSHLDPIETTYVVHNSLTITDESTDFFRATIQLYHVMGNIIDVLYGGNLGCGEDLPNCELTISIMKVRRLLEEWVRQLPSHLSLLQAKSLPLNQSSTLIHERFRMVLNLRFHNIRILAHRIVLVRICDLVAHNKAAEATDLMELRDVAGSVVEACIASSAEIVNLVTYAVRGDCEFGHQLLGAWWFTLYYVFDAAMVLFTVLLLLKRSHSIALPSSISVEAIQDNFSKSLDALGHLDKGNATVERCYWCLKKLGSILGLPSFNNESVMTNSFPSPAFSSYTDVPSLFQPDYMDQSLSFLDFDFMGNERLDFIGDFGQEQEVLV